MDKYLIFIVHFKSIAVIENKTMSFLYKSSFHINFFFKYNPNTRLSLLFVCLKVSLGEKGIEDDRHQIAAYEQQSKVETVVYVFKS